MNDREEYSRVYDPLQTHFFSKILRCISNFRAIGSPAMFNVMVYKICDPSCKIKTNSLFQMECKWKCIRRWALLSHELARYSMYLFLCIFSMHLCLKAFSPSFLKKNIIYFWLKVCLFFIKSKQKVANIPSKPHGRSWKTSFMDNIFWFLFQKWNLDNARLKTSFVRFKVFNWQVCMFH